MKVWYHLKKTSWKYKLLGILGRQWGLRFVMKRPLIFALDKVSECQDFVLPRRRGHSRKNKGHSKDGGVCGSGSVD